MKNLEQQINNIVSDALTMFADSVSAQVETEIKNQVAAALKQQPTPKPKAKKQGLIKHSKFDAVCKLVEMNIPVYLVGEAGTGKNELAKMVADELGLEFYISHKVNDGFEISGFIDGRGEYNETPFFQAFTKGGVFLFDEMDASDENAFALVNAAIANRYMAFPKHGLLYAHENFRVIGNGNTNGLGADDRYTGRRQLDAASLDRFAFVTVDYDERIELAVSGNNQELVDFVHDMRKTMAVTMANSTTISYRCISMVASMEKGGFSTDEALQMALVKGMDRDNLSILYNNLTNKNNKYAKALGICERKLRKQ